MHLVPMYNVDVADRLYICSRLDGKHVVFGGIIEGLDLVKEMERCGTQGGKPSKKVTISDCGQL